jgi:hypothetical protein
MISSTFGGSADGEDACCVANGQRANPAWSPVIGVGRRARAAARTWPLLGLWTSPSIEQANDRGSRACGLRLLAWSGAAGVSAGTIAGAWGCRENPHRRVVAVEISNEPAISALGVTAERHRWRQLIVAVGDIHTAESFPDSRVSRTLRRKPCRRHFS